MVSIYVLLGAVGITAVLNAVCRILARITDEERDFISGSSRVSHDELLERIRKGRDL
jgi:hypothetical protein